MSIIYVLIPLAIIIVGIALVIFFWAVRSNQFDDLERQGYSILFDDDIEDKNQTEANNLTANTPATTSEIDGQTPSKATHNTLKP